MERTEYGPVVTDPRTGEQSCQVFEYVGSECVDAYVTIVRYGNR